MFDDPVGRLKQPLHDDGLGWQPEYPHGHDREQEPPHGFDRMGPVGGGDVDEVVAVVDPVKSPHRRPRVHQPM